MATRFTALLLSFCIGLPMCWCSYGEALRAETAGCCSTEPQSTCSAQQPGSSPDETNDCPCCVHAKDPRDLARSPHFAQRPQFQPLIVHTTGWTDHWKRPHLSAQAVDATCLKRGPPLEPEPLYLRHRALLL